MSGDTKDMVHALHSAALDGGPRADLLNAAADEMLELQAVDEMYQNVAPRLSFLMNNLRRLLEQVGKRSRCKVCNREIWYVQLRSGMVGPYQADGLNHGAGCHGDLNKGEPPCGSSSNPPPGPGPSAA